MPPISFGIGIKALNAPVSLATTWSIRIRPSLLAPQNLDRRHCHRRAASLRDALDYSSSGACCCPRRAEPATPAHASGYATPPIRSDILSGTLANSGGSPKLRADVTGPFAGITQRFQASAAGLGLAELAALTNDQTAAEVLVAGNGSRQRVLSRNIAQERTSSLRARATIACFLCVLPPCVKRWYTVLAQAL
jgi:hypothetical protein